MTDDAAPQALFYHMTATALDDAAPDLLARCHARGWRVVVRAGAAERVEALNRRLWTFREDSFLPHGGPEDGDAAMQPIYLTAGPELPNDPDVLFLVDGAIATDGEFARFRRVASLFDGQDDVAVAAARAQWKQAAAEGAACVYWAQGDGGKWVKRA